MTQSLSGMHPLSINQWEKDIYAVFARNLSVWMKLMMTTMMMMVVTIAITITITIIYYYYYYSYYYYYYYYYYYFC